MKTKLLLSVLLFACAISAQIPVLKTTNQSEMRLIADTIAFSAKRQYEYTSDKYDDNTGMHAYYYTNKEDSTMKISIYFTNLIVGANEALEIKGTKEYRFYTAIGKYLDLFDFWKKYIDQNADVTKCTTASNYKKIGNQVFYFREYNRGLWRLTTN